jgi:hypothetical protein
MRIILMLAAMAGLLMGCGTPDSSASVKPLTHDNIALDLKKYNIATVVPFESQAEGVKNPSIGVVFAKGLAWRLKNNYGSIFSEVNQATSGNGKDELIVTGKFTKYDPGSRDLRFFVGFGLGSSSFAGSLILKDSSDQHIVYEAEFSKLWAWGGLIGKARGIEDMEAETIAAAANRIATARGWNPPVQTSDAHPKYSDYRANLPRLATNQARIWIYRPSRFTGSAVAYTLRLDDADVGLAFNGGFLCLNVEPGMHVVREELLPWTQSVNVDIAGGTEAYILSASGPGSKLEVVAESSGVKEIAGCRLRGN